MCSLQLDAPSGWLFQEDAGPSVPLLPPNLSSPGDPYLCPTFVIMDLDERDLAMQPDSQLRFFIRFRKITYLG